MAGPGARNDTLVDTWSGVHLLTGVAMGWVMAPFWALTLMILWEPLEVLVLSPLSWKLFRREFGHESLRNVMSDIIFDAVGVALGAFALGALVEPPFFLFG